MLVGILWHFGYSNQPVFGKSPPSQINSTITVKLWNKSMSRVTNTLDKVLHFQTVPTSHSPISCKLKKKSIGSGIEMIPHFWVVKFIPRRPWQEFSENFDDAVAGNCMLQRAISVLILIKVPPWILYYGTFYTPTLTHPRWLIPNLAM